MATGEEPQTYCMAFLAKGGLRSCLAKGCPGLATMRTAIRVHLLHQNVLDTVVILEEGPPPPPPTVPLMRLASPLLGTEQKTPFHISVRQGSGAKEAADLREISKRAFKAYGEPLENVTAFKYLGQVLTKGDDD